MKRFMFLSFVVAFFFFATSGVYGAEAQKDNKTKELFEKKCSSCHGLNKVKSAQKKPDEWKTTVERMMGKKNSNISHEDAKVIIEYLSKTHIKGK
ncbi:MAG TPA: photosystem P840 reaction-center cytochrome c-551 [Syntrophorhabdaceae bacterium]|nr:photosystem P840 reaction-center cytochrome c-551 [Syntrophorhabdaceae bacterium]